MIILILNIKVNKKGGSEDPPVCPIISDLINSHQVIDDYATIVLVS